MGYEKDIKSETELCEIFVAAHPRAEHLYFEVHMQSGRADIVHCEHEVVTIYEAKKRLSLELLEQCINRKPYAHLVYAVIPPMKRRNYFLEKLFSEYGIGIISIKTKNIYQPADAETRGYYRNVETLSVLIKSKLNRHPKKFHLYEENKKEIPGVKGNSTSMTPFKIMVKEIKENLSNRRNTKTEVEKVFGHQHYYTTITQFKSNMYQWIKKGVITGIKMEKGVMWLEDKKIT